MDFNNFYICGSNNERPQHQHVAASAAARRFSMRSASVSSEQYAISMHLWGVKQGGSFHMSINVWVAGKTVIPLNTCHPERFGDFTINAVQIYDYSCC